MLLLETVEGMCYANAVRTIIRSLTKVTAVLWTSVQMPLQTVHVEISRFSASPEDCLLY